MKKLLLIICVFLLTGCTDYVEVNDLAIITGIAINYENDMYDIYAQAIINDKESTVVTYNTKSNSIEEAIAEISKLSNKKVFIPDLKVLIITDEVIKNKSNYYDYFLRSNESKMDFYVYIVNKDEIKDIFSIYKDKFGSSLYADSMMDFNHEVFSSSTPLDFLNLIKTILDEGINPVYPVITIKEVEGEKVLYLKNLVTFNDNKEKVVLSENNSIFYNILTNNIENTVFTIECGDKYFATTINNINTKISYKDNNLEIKIKSEGKIDSYSCEYNLDDNNTKNILNDLINDYIEKNVNEIIDMIISNEVDFIGFSNYVYRNKYNDYKDFDLSKVNIKIKPDSSITSFGESRKKVGDINGKNK